MACCPADYGPTKVVGGKVVGGKVVRGKVVRGKVVRDIEDFSQVSAVSVKSVGRCCSGVERC